MQFNSMHALRDGQISVPSETGGDRRAGCRDGYKLVTPSRSDKRFPLRVERFLSESRVSFRVVSVTARVQGNSTDWVFRALVCDYRATPSSGVLMSRHVQREKA